MQHAAKLNNSPMLQSICKILSDWQWHTTKEIADKTGCVCVSTRISELKRNIVHSIFVNDVMVKQIKCRYVGKTNKGNKIYQYRMLGEV